jgi:hypothetical protein
MFYHAPDLDLELRLGGRSKTILLINIILLQESARSMGAQFIELAPAIRSRPVNFN